MAKKVISHTSKILASKQALAILDNNLNANFTELYTAQSVSTSGILPLKTKTVKVTVGGVGVAGCDFNFATAANTSEQVITLGALIPSLGKLVDIFTHTNSVFTGATSLLAKLGTTSGGNELVDSTTIYAANVVTGGDVIPPAPVVSTTTIYLSATPGANWVSVTAGKISVYITYIDIANL